MVINKYLGGSVTPGSFSKKTAEISSLRSMTSPAIAFDQVYSSRNEFPPVKQASIIIRKPLVIPIIVMPLLHQWVHLALQMCLVTLWGGQLGKIIDFSPPTAYVTPPNTTKASQQRRIFQLRSILISLYSTITILSCHVCIC